MRNDHTNNARKNAEHSDVEHRQCRNEDKERPNNLRILTEVVENFRQNEFSIGQDDSSHLQKIKLKVRLLFFEWQHWQYRYKDEYQSNNEKHWIPIQNDEKGRHTRNGDTHERTRIRYERE